jgi:stage V sporulation protein AC
MGIDTKNHNRSERVQRFQQYANQTRPKKTVATNLAWAFLVGGLISLFGQAVMWGFEQAGMSSKAAATPTSIVLVGLGALLTGLGWYDRIVKRGGMGGTLPITGFANAMVAPAMEYRSEGLVLGIGAKLFTVAGPVLVYGMAMAFIVGVVRYGLGLSL